MTAINHSFIPYKYDEVEPYFMQENNVIDMNISLVDAFMNAEVLLPQGEESEGYEGSSLVKAKVIHQFCDEDGNVMSNTNIQPELNTLMYELEFPDGEIRPYAANVIADNIWVQVDPEGLRYVIFELIIDHHIDSSVAITKENMYLSVNGRRTMQRTTTGVKLLVLCKDGSEQWFPLKDLKELNPV